MSKTSDNVNLDFPARMADGRIFTDYRPNCVMNQFFSTGKNSFDYRYYLTQNTEAIQKNIISELEKATKCDSCNAQTVLPVQTIQNCNAGVCTMKMNDPQGLGLDRSNTYKQ
tara:strand:+ start:649 stop:984 length:336 start_codon:yes stop_codon:yes gene_type:complete